MINIIIKIEKMAKLEDLKKITNLEGMIFLFGETHRFINDLAVQKDILKEINAEYYLYEMLEETKLLTNKEKDIFLKKSDDKDFSIISKYGELKPIIALSKELNLKLIGCDIKDMCRKDRSFLTKTELSPNDIKIENGILIKRERKQAEKIIEYLGTAIK